MFCVNKIEKKNLKQLLKSHRPIVLPPQKVTGQLSTGQLSAGQLSTGQLSTRQLSAHRSASKRVQIESYHILVDTLVLKKLHWLPVEHPSDFKKATLVYKFLDTDIPKYFAPYISLSSRFCSTRHSQSGGNSLAVPKFQPFIHKSVKQFGYSFAFMPPLLGMFFLV